MEVIEMSAAQAIKRIRMALLFEQEEFAELIGVSKQSVCNYEKGVRQPRLPVIRKILEVAKKNKIKASAEDFLSNEGT